MTHLTHNLQTWGDSGRIKWMQFASKLKGQCVKETIVIIYSHFNEKIQIKYLIFEFFLERELFHHVLDFLRGETRKITVKSNENKGCSEQLLGQFLAFGSNLRSNFGHFSEQLMPRLSLELAFAGESPLIHVKIQKWDKIRGVPIWKWWDKCNVSSNQTFAFDNNKEMVRPAVKILFFAFFDDDMWIVFSARQILRLLFPLAVRPCQSSYSIFFVSPGHKDFEFSTYISFFLVFHFLAFPQSNFFHVSIFSAAKRKHKAFIGDRGKRSKYEDDREETE